MLSLPDRKRKRKLEGKVIEREKYNNIEEEKTVEREGNQIKEGKG